MIASTDKTNKNALFAQHNVFSSNLYCEHNLAFGQKLDGKTGKKKYRSLSAGFCYVEFTSFILSYQRGYPITNCETQHQAGWVMTDPTSYFLQLN